MFGVAVPCLKDMKEAPNGADNKIVTGSLIHCNTLNEVHLFQHNDYAMARNYSRNDVR